MAKQDAKIEKLQYEVQDFKGTMSEFREKNLEELLKIMEDIRKYAPFNQLNIRGEVKSDMATIRGELKVGAEKFMGDVKLEMTKFRENIQNEMIRAEANMEKYKNELQTSFEQKQTRVIATTGAVVLVLATFLHVLVG